MLLKNVLPALVGLALLAASAGTASAVTWETLNDPLAPNATGLAAIQGNLIVGDYTLNNLNYGCLYNTQSQTWTTLSDPSAGSSGVGQGTQAAGISNGNVVGTYTDSANVEHGFIYNIAANSWQTLNYPNFPSGDGTGTALSAISGNLIFGGASDLRTHASQEFTYDGTNWTAFPNDPAGTGTRVYGEAAGLFYGIYFVQATPIGFTYDGTHWTTILYPARIWNGPENTQVSAIAGHTIVGSYNTGTQHGFIYNGTTWTSFDDPSAGQGTFFGGTDGTNVVGSYYDSTGRQHGLLALNIIPSPEPSSLLLLAIGALGALALARRKR